MTDLIQGLNHITFSVSDIDRSFHFYHEVLGFRPKLKWDSGAYFLAGDLWFCLSLDKETRGAPLQEYTHIAFSASQENFEKMKARILEYGCSPFKENQSEGDSFYFLDPDGHKLEIHCGSLESRLEFYKNENKKGLSYFE